MPDGGGAPFSQASGIGWGSQVEEGVLPAPRPLLLLLLRTLTGRGCCVLGLAPLPHCASSPYPPSQFFSSSC